ncbi:MULTISPECIES: protein translocase subunit SecF [Curtobacterium]|jgi:preprotein translocase subunit SecF|uniref:Protein-export membrane protein SecF n=1 Tax=Curtobacterium flaccumfaciens pv. flaccumfaciens TaxID=138532 RepID=A0A9Q2W4M4_9MICO|nr:MULTISPECIES: protein translocase subunit SecF [Curtobacterium]KQR34684.1 preprotein translocase subunit SecF [Curtobacterium sp. Leaf154]MBF4597453.1 protein translocase subunit SecF [Curtobacterium sp. VKM Ac-1796]MBF4612751.1 protein translocase subunit SecF [Curtobacterium sp. VKM Ac-2889]MBT1543347.1 protein translocase subunit SecF [Curtobacterium flaccumfaciens pv. flaccumfaciens]MBT1597539.1 protein translocase subunit SecF [Curtobacterium flaccumfaciens pv. flaccumfaciens]
MASFSQFGSDLYTGKRSYDIIGRRKTWYLIALAMIVISLVTPWLRGGYQLGIEFTGGSEFTISDVKSLDQSIATDTVESVVADTIPRVSQLGTHGIRVQTGQLTDAQTTDVQDALAKAYDVPERQVAATFIGATWGADVLAQAIRGLVIFLALAAVFMTLYFRTWKMSLSAMAALLHDLLITAGVYGIVGLEVTPAAVIGFLTILGYSLYDTVVVFDKVRENTAQESIRTFKQSVNLAVNQTLVRSINTSVVALLPVAAILFIGSYVLGAGTLRDISLALFIGIIVGTYSTIFIASPMYAQLRENEPKIKESDAKKTAAAEKRRREVDAAEASV